MQLPPLTPAEKTRLASLQPHVAEAFLAMRQVVAAQLGLRIVLTSGTRTFDEQRALYSLGRTKPGKRVTNARPGQSLHNFGLAFDVAIQRAALDWNITPAVAAIGERIGLEWGGRWKSFTDVPHFQLTRGLTLAQCNARWPQGWRPSNG